MAPPGTAEIVSTAAPAPHILRQYALVADGERGALIGPRGDVAWLCAPRSACGPPGLFAEEFDVAERQLRGNLPQAFVHALLLECSATLTPMEVLGGDAR